MAIYSVVKSGGKQYLVKDGDTVVVDRVNMDTTKKTELEVLMSFNDETSKVDIGAPVLDKKVSAEVVEHLKGDKVRVAKFKSKVRYRKVRGFRPSLTKIKIG